MVPQGPFPKLDRVVGELGMTVITTLERSRQEDQKLKAILGLEASLDYLRPCFQKPYKTAKQAGWRALEAVRQYWSVVRTGVSCLL